MRNKSAVKRT